MKMYEILEVLSPAAYVAVSEVGKDWEFKEALVYPPIPFWEWKHGGYLEWYGIEVPAKKDLAEREIAQIRCMYDTIGEHPYIDIEIWGEEEKEG